MEDEAIKSALELAMERISALPQLTPQEIAEQKERENAPVGKAIAVKYINGMLSDAELPVELSRHEGERRQIIRRAFLAAICGEMRFGNNAQDASKALRGAVVVVPQKELFCEEAVRRFGQILDEFEAAKEKMAGEFESLAGQKMKELGISGSAVRPNLNENDRWKQEMAAMRQAFGPKLEIIRKTLLEELLQGQR